MEVLLKVGWSFNLNNSYVTGSNYWVAGKSRAATGILSVVRYGPALLASCPQCRKAACLSVIPKFFPYWKLECLVLILFF